MVDENITRKKWVVALAAVALLGGSGATLTGCVADGPQPPTPTKPRDLPAPRGLAADRLLLAVGDTPLDTDGDGYADTFEATVYLFSGRADLPFHAEGTFQFILVGAGGQQLATWVLPPERASTSRMKTIVGEGYLFRLDLNDAGGDRLDGARATLIAAFISSEPGASPVSASTSVRAGRVGTARPRSG